MMHQPYRVGGEQQPRHRDRWERGEEASSKDHKLHAHNCMEEDIDGVVAADGKAAVLMVETEGPDCRCE